MDFEALLEQLRAFLADGEANPLDDGFVDTLGNGYNDFVGSAQASQDSLNGVIAEKDAEIARLKGINFDLLMEVRGSDPDESIDDSDDSSDDSMSYDDLYDEDKE